MAREVYVGRSNDVANPRPPGERRRWVWREPTGYTFYRAWQQVGQQGLTGVEFRLLCACLGRVTWTNVVRVSLAQLGRDVGLTLPQASRAMRRLNALEWVLPLTDERGGRTGYRVSPVLTWQGRPWVCHLARVQYAALAWYHRHRTAGATSPGAPQRPSPTPDGTQPAREAPFPASTPLEVTASLST